MGREVLLFQISCVGECHLLDLPQILLKVFGVQEVKLNEVKTPQSQDLKDAEAKPKSIQRRIEIVVVKLEKN
jgi:hypothetical protein